MSADVEFLFDFGSPNAYLAHLVIPDIEQRTGAKFEYVPVLLGGVFKATGNASPAVTLAGIKNKPEYEALEVKRFIKRHSLEERFQFNPHFPINTLQVMRGAVAAKRLSEDTFGRYVQVVYAAMWSTPVKMDDPEVIAQTLAAADLPAQDLMAAIQDPAVKTELIENTESAVARGVFGSPSFFVGGELYFGKNTLGEVEEQIAAVRSP
jgi:2-hydroxychromene-2-carboxylate isomerase